CTSRISAAWCRNRAWWKAPENSPRRRADGPPSFSASAARCCANGWCRVCGWARGARDEALKSKTRAPFGARACRSSVHSGLVGADLVEGLADITQRTGAVMADQGRGAVHVELHADEERVGVGTGDLIALIAAIDRQRQRVGELPFRAELLGVEVAQRAAGEVGRIAGIVGAGAESQVRVQVVHALHADIAAGVAAGGVVAAALQRQGDVSREEPVGADTVRGGVTEINAARHRTEGHAAEERIGEEVATGGPQVGGARVGIVVAAGALEAPAAGAADGGRQAAIDAINVGAAMVGDAGIATAEGAGDLGRGSARNQQGGRAGRGENHVTHKESPL